MADSDPSKPKSTNDPAISRRDFLRRAGVEAATTGTKLVPGAAIAQKVLGIGTPIAPAPIDETGKPAPSGLAQKIAEWRKRREGGSAPQ